jgi:hypothetical protein
MKRAILLINLFFIALFISSCINNGELSVTKRQYRNGYSVEYSFKKRKNFDQSKYIEAFSGYSNDRRAATATVLANEKEIYADAQSPIESEKATRERPSRARAHSEKFLVDERTLAKAQATISEKKSKSKPVNTNKIHDNGDSIVWTLISIFLLLWLISLLTGGWGLGGLIYLFLLVAVVLLLLKLLNTI